MTTRRARWLVVALFAVAAVVAAIPAVGGFRSEFMADGAPGYGEAASGDHLQATYRFWLVGHQLEQGAAPWVDPYSFQPLVEPQTVLGGWPYGLPFWPADALWGPVVAWNLLLLLVTVAAGLFAYLWLRELEIPVAAAALGGLAFELAPYRLFQSGGHLLGWIAVLVPLALWAYERSRRATGRAAHAWGALSAAAIVSVPLSGQLHLALGVLPFVAAYAAIRFAWPASLWVWGGAAAAAVAGFAAEAIVIEGTTEEEGRTLAEVAYYSASPLDLLSRWQLAGPERFAYLGWLLPALAIAGLVLLARRRSWGLALLLGLAALLPALLALGTNLPLYETLRDVFPPLRYPRVPGRFLPLANLALAALAAVAAAAAVARFHGRRRTAVAGVLLALVAADLLVFPLRGSDADPGNPAYAAVAGSGPGRVLELPIFQRGKGQFGSVYQYYTLQAPRERPTGYALAPDEAFEFTERYNRLECGAWLEDDRRQLRRLGIRSFVWHGGLYEQSETPGAWFGWEGLRLTGLGIAAGEPPVFLWTEGLAAEPLADEPDRGEPFLCDAWVDGKLTLPEGALWLYGEGTAELEVETLGPTVVSVYADARPVEPVVVDGRATIRVELPNRAWHAFVVQAPPGLRLLRVGFE